MKELAKLCCFSSTLKKVILRNSEIEPFELKTFVDNINDNVDLTNLDLGENELGMVIIS
jgi:hypothetical protein